MATVASRARMLATQVLRYEEGDLLAQAQATERAVERLRRPLVHTARPELAGAIPCAEGSGGATVSR